MQNILKYAKKTFLRTQNRTNRIHFLLYLD